VQLSRAGKSGHGGKGGIRSKGQTRRGQPNDGAKRGKRKVFVARAKVRGDVNGEAKVIKKKTPVTRSKRGKEPKIQRAGRVK